MNRGANENDLLLVNHSGFDSHRDVADGTSSKVSGSTLSHGDHLSADAGIHLVFSWAERNPKISQ